MNQDSFFFYRRYARRRTALAGRNLFEFGRRNRRNREVVDGGKLFDIQNGLFFAGGNIAVILIDHPLAPPDAGLHEPEAHSVGCRRFYTVRLQRIQILRVKLAHESVKRSDDTRIVISLLREKQKTRRCFKSDLRYFFFDCFRDVFFARRNNEPHKILSFLLFRLDSRVLERRPGNLAQA